MPDYRASINHMLVHLFNDILRIEETPPCETAA